MMLQVTMMDTLLSLKHLFIKNDFFLIFYKIILRITLQKGFRPQKFQIHILLLKNHKIKIIFTFQASISFSDLFTSQHEHLFERTTNDTIVPNIFLFSKEKRDKNAFLYSGSILHMLVMPSNTIIILCKLIVIRSLYIKFICNYCCQAHRIVISREFVKSFL